MLFTSWQMDAFSALDRTGKALVVSRLDSAAVFPASATWVERVDPERPVYLSRQKIQLKTYDRILRYVK
jgi:hypothetical protein